jgi:hypothetical protein
MSKWWLRFRILFWIRWYFKDRVKATLVYSQILLETKNLEDNVYTYHHNYFGMKYPSNNRINKGYSLTRTDINIRGEKGDRISTFKNVRRAIKSFKLFHQWVNTSFVGKVSESYKHYNYEGACMLYAETLKSVGYYEVSIDHYAHNLFAHYHDARRQLKKNALIEKSVCAIVSTIPLILILFKNGKRKKKR